MIDQRTATDVLELNALLHRLARAMDERNWELLASCYDPDSTGNFATGESTGVARIVAQYRGFLTPLDLTQHLITNTEHVIKSDRARTSSYFLAQHVRAGTAGGDQYVIGGRYDDQMRRTPGGWRVAARTVTGLWTQGNRAVVGATLDERAGTSGPDA